MGTGVDNKGSIQSMLPITLVMNSLQYTLLGRIGDRSIKTANFGTPLEKEDTPETPSKTFV